MMMMRTMLKTNRVAMMNCKSVFLSFHIVYVWG